MVDSPASAAVAPAAPAVPVVDTIFNKIMLGGFLKGYRTPIITVVTIGSFLLPWAFGDASLATVVTTHWQDIAIALGLMTAATH